MFHFMQGDLQERTNMMVLGWLSIATFFSLYAILPSLLSLGLGIGVYKRKPIQRGLAFTFDDGPNPKYTPQLLDLLKKYKIKATFFVLGSKVEQYPHLIHRIHQEGHLLGVHNYVHRSNWFRLPWIIRREIEQSATLIEHITGVRPIYYRPLGDY